MVTIPPKGSSLTPPPRCSARASPRTPAAALGADHYYATSDENTFTDLAGSFDLIINTVGAKIDISSYLQLLSLDGALVNLGAPAEPLPVNLFSLIMGRRSFAGSMIGGIREIQEMLEFCADTDSAQRSKSSGQQDQRRL